MNTRTAWINSLLNRFPEDEQERARGLLSQYWEYAKNLSINFQNDVSPGPFCLGGIASIAILEYLTNLPPVSKAILTFAGSVVTNELVTNQAEKNMADREITNSLAIRQLGGKLKMPPDSLHENLTQLEKQLNYIKAHIRTKKSVGYLGAAAGACIGYVTAPLHNFETSEHGVVAAAQSDVFGMVGHTVARVGLFAYSASVFKEDSPAQQTGLRRRQGQSGSTG